MRSFNCSATPASHASPRPARRQPVRVPSSPPVMGWSVGFAFPLQPQPTMSVYDRLKELGIQLPPLAIPAAAYVPFVRTGKLAARAIAIDLLGTLHAAIGDLNKVEHIVKVMSLVNSTAEFTEQHLVTNGCSELLGEVFADKGAHARSAFGVAQIPLGACVEIELIAQVA